MGQVKECWLNGLEQYQQDVITGFCERENGFLDRLAYHLALGVVEGWLDRDYAEYLMQRPCEGADWLREYHNVNI